MARYLSRLRPIGIGCFPKYDDNKVVEIHNFDYKGDFLEVGVDAWGYIDYEHKIPESDAKHYSFTRIIDD